MKLALAMIVKGDDTEAKALAKCLSYVKEHIDAIYVTITHKAGQERNSAVERVAKLFEARISDFEWVNDFATARNYSFSQVPPEYTHILWLDADDAVRGIEKLRGVIESNPDVDAFTMFYLYAFDEHKNPIVVHQKTQVVKNDGCVVWQGYLHEDFKPTRALNVKLVEGIERIHLTDEDRIHSAKERNLEVAQNDAKHNPEDPRSYWNLGNSLKALSRDVEALEAFDKFLKSSGSEDEKYIVRLRRAECYWSLGKKAEAMDEARSALGLRPNYPDAYHLTGSLLFESKRYKEAAEHYIQGLVKKPPYYSIIVYNPRDYDYVPMMNLAKTYFALSRPDLALPLLEGCKKIYPKDKALGKTIRLMKKEAAKFEKVVNLIAKLQKIEDKEKLSKALDDVPDDFKSHPGICNLRNINFVKEKSSGKDLVIFCGFTTHEWTPETARTKGIGGSEEAVIWLSRLLADKGWNVTVYNNCGHRAQNFDGVTYKPFWSWNYRDKQDVVIVWRAPRYLDYEINAKKVYLDMHDVVEAGEFTPSRVNRVSKIFVKSKFHRDLFPHVSDEKFVIVPNGIDAEKFKEVYDRDPYLMVNTSSPDRSISALLDCFEEVKRQVPEAKLAWMYGWNVFDDVHSDNPKIMDWKDKQVKRMRELGVEDLGKVSHGKVAEMYLKANIFAYPSEFAEIDCISLTKALASGAIPVTTNFAAMGEKEKYGGYYVHSYKTKDTWAKPYQFDFGLESPEGRKAWVDYVVKILKNSPSELERENMRDQTRKDFDWDRIAEVWHQTIS